MCRKKVAAVRDQTSSQGWVDHGNELPSDTELAVCLGTTIPRAQMSSLVAPFEFSNAVPARIVIDNPKCAIARACYHDPQVQRAYAECAEGFGFLIMANPPRDPKKKGGESGVKRRQSQFLPGAPVPFAR